MKDIVVIYKETHNDIWLEHHIIVAEWNEIYDTIKYKDYVEVIGDGEFIFKDRVYKIPKRIKLKQDYEGIAQFLHFVKEEDI